MKCPNCKIKVLDDDILDGLCSFCRENPEAWIRERELELFGY